MHRNEADELWVAVLEYAWPTTGRPSSVADLECLIDYLYLWQPSGLWSPDRYALQLQIRAPVPHVALAQALAFHHEAAESLGLPATTLIRVEIVTFGEFETSFEEFDAPSVAVASAGARGLVCNELYAATRGLLAATTAAEVSGIVAGFVASVGGWVEPGAPCHAPGTTDIDISFEGEPPRHAVADSMSVVGLIIEQFLPGLLTDARSARRRVRKRDLKGDSSGTGRPFT